MFLINTLFATNFLFITIPNFGPEIHKSIKQFNYEEADTLISLLNIVKTPKQEPSEDAKLIGMNIVITGKLSIFKNRNELKQVIIQNGGKVSDSINAKTTLLINNDINSSSAKNKAAKAKNIPIISEQEFKEKYLDK